MIVRSFEVGCLNLLRNRYYKLAAIEVFFCLLFGFHLWGQSKFDSASSAESAKS